MGKSGLAATVKKLPRTFWVANTMEIFERMAWYGYYALSSLYITGKVEEGALGFTSEQRGFLQGVVLFFLYLFPVVTGALGDRFGYKKMFLIAFSVLTPAYYLLGQFKGFGAFLAVFMLVAVGAAIFKPVVLGTVARSSDESAKGLAFGIFYMMVNVGGFVGPQIAGMARTRHGWGAVFVLSAIWISVNFLWVILFYKEPTTESASEKKRTLREVWAGIVEVIGNGRLFLTVAVILVVLVVGGGSSKLEWKWVGVVCAAWLAVNFFYDLALSRDSAGRRWFAQRMRIGNWRFTLYLLVLSGFWTVFNQIFMTMPEYLRDYTDTTPLLRWAEGLFAGLGLTGAAAWVQEMIRTGYQINPEYLVNLDAGAIVVFQVVVSWGLARLPPFTTMIVGLVVTAGSMGVAALGGCAVGVTAWIAVASILVFSFGEMATSPKSQEYVALIAPQEQVAMYMGYYFVSIALGNLFGGLLSGGLYGWLARDLKRPDLMWLAFAALGLATTAALAAYNRWVLPKEKAAP